MSKILKAEDILTEARDCIECIGMAAAASHLASEFGAPIAAVANVATRKIDEAVELLAECWRGEPMAPRFRLRLTPSRNHRRRERRGAANDGYSFPATKGLRAAGHHRDRRFG